MSSKSMITTLTIWVKRPSQSAQLKMKSTLLDPLMETTGAKLLKPVCSPTKCRAVRVAEDQELAVSLMILLSDLMTNPPHFLLFITE